MRTEKEQFQASNLLIFRKKRGFLFAFAAGACYIISCLICGEMAEWSKAQHWKCCIGATLSWVQIPLSPPFLCSKSGILPHFFPIFPRFPLKNRARSCILCRNLPCRLDNYDHESPKKRTHPTNERVTRQTKAKASRRPVLLQTDGRERGPKGVFPQDVRF